MNHRSTAFTLVELLVVLAILGLLAGLLLPQLGKAGERARVAVCRSNLQQIGVALRLYLDEHGNRFPSMANRPRGTNLVVTNSPEIVLAPQLGPSAVWRCPSDRQRLYEDTGSSYDWNFLLNGQPASQVRLMSIPMSENGFTLFSDKTGFHAALGPARSRNFLNADGAVKQFFLFEPER